MLVKWSGVSSEVIAGPQVRWNSQGGYYFYAEVCIHMGLSVVAHMRKCQIGLRFIRSVGTAVREWCVHVRGTLMIKF